ncbi:MAG: coproporphyrinogen dehydrogenase HemZ [Clostridia bacterium]|nr:coproporphyrinogen dehydrogenase HemZ [Clostridia bacterium]
MRIQFGFPGEHPGYHPYEALQIFGDGNCFPELVPNQSQTWLKQFSDNGELLQTVFVPEIEDHRILKQMIYDTMVEFTGYRSPWGCMTGIRPAKIINQLLSKGQTPEAAKAHLMDFYRVSEEKADFALETALSQHEFLEEQKTNPKRIGIYIGIPFCPTRCLYCSFPSNSIGKYKKVVDTYLDLLREEMEDTYALTQALGLEIESVYLGGGTPTSLSNEQFRRYMEDVTRIFTRQNPHLKEFSLEAGRPDSITLEKLQIAKASGVTRMSVNPQTMQDETLKLIGRHHTAAQIVDAFQMARSVGMDNINMDVIAGLPGENLEHFTRTLSAIRALKPDGITVHTLSVKRAADLKRDEKRAMLENAQVGAMVACARQVCKEMGMHPFYMYRQKNMLGNHENAAYCKPGKDSPYNIHIMEEDQTILAIGAGGVSKRVEGDRIERAFNVKSVEEYVARSREMMQRKRDLMGNPGGEV